MLQNHRLNNRFITESWQKQRESLRRPDELYFFAVAAQRESEHQPINSWQLEMEKTRCASLMAIGQKLEINVT